jgi:hypothetical protein
MLLLPLSTATVLYSICTIKDMTTNGEYSSTDQVTKYCGFGLVALEAFEIRWEAKSHEAFKFVGFRIEKDLTNYKVL